MVRDVGSVDEYAYYGPRVVPEKARKLEARRKLVAEQTSGKES